MSEVVREKVVAVRREPCVGDERRQHPIGIWIDGKGEMLAEDAISVLDAGGELYMIPPPGAPAYSAHVATDLPLILQHRLCDKCGREVLFA